MPGPYDPPVRGLLTRLDQSRPERDDRPAQIEAILEEMQATCYAISASKAALEAAQDELRLKRTMLQDQLEALIRRISGQSHMSVLPIVRALDLLADTD
jgi:hypothetical protein